MHAVHKYMYLTHTCLRVHVQTLHVRSVVMAFSGIYRIYIQLYGHLSKTICGSYGMPRATYHYCTHASIGVPIIIHFADRVCPLLKTLYFLT